MSARRAAGLTLSLLVAALAALPIACNDAPPPAAIEEGTKVRIGDLTIQAELARTPEERARGLSGRPSLPEDGGMLFVLSEERRPAFWMLDMRFPLDFIWVSSDGRVADLTQDVPPPEPGASQLPRYQPVRPVLYVLEVNAGTVRRAGVEIGDAVTFDPPVSAVETP